MYKTHLYLAALFSKLNMLIKANLTIVKLVFDTNTDAKSHVKVFVDFV